MIHITVNGQQQYDLQEHEQQWQLAGNNDSLSVEKMENGQYSIIRNGKSYTAVVDEVNREAKTIILRVNSIPYTLTIEEPIDRLLKSMGIDSSAGAKAEAVKAPMPGMILRILVAPGQQIEKGDGLIILEAMKMENVLKATAAGTVKAIRVTEKTAVEKGTVLIEME